MTPMDMSILLDSNLQPSDYQPLALSIDEWRFDGFGRN